MLHNFQVVSFLATIIITQSGFVYSISFDPYNTTLWYRYHYHHFIAKETCPRFPVCSQCQGEPFFLLSRQQSPCASYVPMMPPGKVVYEWLYQFFAILFLAWNPCWFFHHSQNRAIVPSSQGDCNDKILKNNTCLKINISKGTYYGLT